MANVEAILKKFIHVFEQWKKKNIVEERLKDYGFKFAEKNQPSEILTDTNNLDSEA